MLSQWWSGRAGASVSMMLLAPGLLVLLEVVLLAEAGTHLDEPWFRWRGGRVPFHFQGMENSDRAVIRAAMRSIERRTCLRFQEQRGPLAGHHLLVRGSRTTCLSGPGGVPRSVHRTSQGTIAWSSAAAEIPQRLKINTEIIDCQTSVNFSESCIFNKMALETHF